MRCPALQPEDRRRLTAWPMFVLFMCAGCMTENEAGYAGSRVLQSQATTPAQALFFGLAGDIFAARSVGEHASGNPQYMGQETVAPISPHKLIKVIRERNGGASTYSIAFERWDDDGDGILDVDRECRGISDHFYLPTTPQVVFMTDLRRIKLDTTVYFHLYRENEVEAALSRSLYVPNGHRIVRVGFTAQALSQAGITGRCLVNWRLGDKRTVVDVYHVNFSGTVSPTGYFEMDEFFRESNEKYDQKERELFRK